MFKEIFISYGRRESLNFVARLHQVLKLAGYAVWFDKVNIPDVEDYALRIAHGIESAHNFIYVMAPRALCSPYCLIELEYARWLGKRLIPINQMVIFSTEDVPLSSADQQILTDFYLRYKIKDPQIKTTQQVLDHSLAQIGRSDWLDGKAVLDDADCVAMTRWAQSYENNWHKHDDLSYLQAVDLPIFGELIDAPASIFECLDIVLKRQRTYVVQQTDLLLQALTWQAALYDSRYLLAGKARQAAEKWLLQQFYDGDQAPCVAGVLLCDFLSDSRKNAENLATDVFICGHVTDQDVQQDIFYQLARHNFTAWRAEPFQALTGIEQADNFLYVLSADSVIDTNCQQQLQHAQHHNKRVILLRLDVVVPVLLQSLPVIDYQQENVWSELFSSLQYEFNYHQQHKLLLSMALCWINGEQNPAVLLRGYNLENAQTWLRLQQQRADYPPTKLHKDFIFASEAAKGQLGTDVFISYSRKDSDFVRKLNIALQNAGKTTWFDQESIAAGMKFEEELYRGINAADNFLFIISPNAVESSYCKTEINYAQKQGKRLLTLLSTETLAESLPSTLRSLNWIDFAGNAFDKAFQNLIQSLDIDQDYVHLHTRFQQRAFEWQSNQTSHDFLLNESTCDKAEAWLKLAKQAQKYPIVTQLQKNYIKASRDLIAMRYQHRQRRHQRIFISLTLGLVVTLSLASFAWFQKNKARTAEQQALSSYRQAQANYFRHTNPFIDCSS